MALFRILRSIGPFITELEDNDRAEFLEKKTPALETTKFLELMILVALKALDIPYSFWNESFKPARSDCRAGFFADRFYLATWRWQFIH